MACIIILNIWYRGVPCKQCSFLSSIITNHSSSWSHHIKHSPPHLQNNNNLSLTILLFFQSYLPLTYYDINYHIYFTNINSNLNMQFKIKIVWVNISIILTINIACVFTFSFSFFFLKEGIMFVHETLFPFFYKYLRDFVFFFPAK